MAETSQWSRTCEGIERCTRARPDLTLVAKTTNQTKRVLSIIHPEVIYLRVVGRKHPRNYMSQSTLDPLYNMRPSYHDRVDEQAFFTSP